MDYFYYQEKLCGSCVVQIVYANKNTMQLIMNNDCPPAIKILEDPSWCIEYTIYGWWDNFAL